MPLSSPTLMERYIVVMTIAVYNDILELISSQNELLCNTTFDLCKIRK